MGVGVPRGVRRGWGMRWQLHELLLLLLQRWGTHLELVARFSDEPALRVKLNRGQHMAAGRLELHLEEVLDSPRHAACC